MIEVHVGPSWSSSEGNTAQEVQVVQSVLLWWDSNQELNSKDIKDFLCFLMGIHAPSNN
jgi:hypothetical protein